MLGVVDWLYNTKAIKAKDIDWYSITKLFAEYKRYQKDEANENDEKEKRR